MRQLPLDAGQRPLALVGFMGIGKTTVGRELARRLGWSFVDTDAAVETTSNMTIREIFDWFGEPRFRELEHEVISTEITRPRRILALGGGAFIQASNRDLLLECCTVVYLAAPWGHFAHSIHRLKNSRPLLRGRPMPELEQLFHTRHSLYDGAHVRVAVPGRRPPEVAARVIELTGLGGV